ncbi:MAG: helix-turn-helix domain-containing protein [Betaproteobacteria bacterium]|nr:helix-turn-helix domain-containing protein [Betaproteobacteria bacterium]
MQNDQIPSDPIRRMRLLSIRAAADEIGIGRKAIREAIRSGALRPIKIGARTLRLTPADLQRWLDENRISPPIAVDVRVDARVAARVRREAALDAKSRNRREHKKDASKK